MKLHGGFPHIYRTGPALTQMMHTLERFGMHRSDALYTSSSQYAALVAREYALDESTIRVIPYGINLEHIDHAREIQLADRFPALAGKRIVLLSVGASPGRKGAAVFVEAARGLHDHDVQFVLVASVPSLPDDDGLPSNVQVLECLDQPDFFALVAASDLVVVPSQFETFTIATYEAMLLGRSVVVSQHVPIEGPAREYPHLRRLERLNASCLTESIAHALAAKPLAPVDGELTARLRNAFSIATVARDTLAYYRETVDRYRQSAR
jgi:glycosyltransferase involved in cell wall biosynthesis